MSEHLGMSSGGLFVDFVRSLDLFLVGLSERPHVWLPGLFVVAMCLVVLLYEKRLRLMTKVMERARADCVLASTPNAVDAKRVSVIRVEARRIKARGGKNRRPLVDFQSYLKEQQAVAPNADWEEASSVASFDIEAEAMGDDDRQAKWYEVRDRQRAKRSVRRSVLVENGCAGVAFGEDQFSALLHRTVRDDIKRWNVGVHVACVLARDVTPITDSAFFDIDEFQGGVYRIVARYAPGDDDAQILVQELQRIFANDLETLRVFVKELDRWNTKYDEMKALHDDAVAGKTAIKTVPSKPLVSGVKVGGPAPIVVSDGKPPSSIWNTTFGQLTPEESKFAALAVLDQLRKQPSSAAPEDASFLAMASQVSQVAKTAPPEKKAVKTEATVSKNRVFRHTSVCLQYPPDIDQPNEARGTFVKFPGGSGPDGTFQGVTLLITCKHLFDKNPSFDPSCLAGRHLCVDGKKVQIQRVYYNPATSDCVGLSVGMSVKNPVPIGGLNRGKVEVVGSGLSAEGSATTHYPQYQGYSNVVLADYNTASGDSGALVCQEGHAVGVHTGEIGDYNVFTLIPQALNRFLLPTPKVTPPKTKAPSPLLTSGSQSVGPAVPVVEVVGAAASGGASSPVIVHAKKRKPAQQKKTVPRPSQVVAPVSVTVEARLQRVARKKRSGIVAQGPPPFPADRYPVQVGEEAEILLASTERFRRAPGYAWDGSELCEAGYRVFAQDLHEEYERTFYAAQDRAAATIVAARRERPDEFRALFEQAVSELNPAASTGACNERRLVCVPASNAEFMVWDSRQEAFEYWLDLVLGGWRGDVIRVQLKADKYNEKKIRTGGIRSLQVPFVMCQLLQNMLCGGWVRFIYEHPCSSVTCDPSTRVRWSMTALPPEYEKLCRVGRPFGTCGLDYDAFDGSAHPEEWKMFYSSVPSPFREYLVWYMSEGPFSDIHGQDHGRLPVGNPSGCKHTTAFNTFRNICLLAPLCEREGLNPKSCLRVVGDDSLVVGIGVDRATAQRLVAGVASLGVQAKIEGVTCADETNHFATAPFLSYVTKWHRGLPANFCSNVQRRVSGATNATDEQLEGIVASLAGTFVCADLGLVDDTNLVALRAFRMWLAQSGKPEQWIVHPSILYFPVVKHDLRMSSRVRRVMNSELGIA